MREIFPCRLPLKKCQRHCLDTKITIIRTRSVYRQEGCSGSRQRGLPGALLQGRRGEGAGDRWPGPHPRGRGAPSVTGPPLGGYHRSGASCCIRYPFVGLALIHLDIVLDLGLQHRIRGQRLDSISKDKYNVDERGRQRRNGGSPVPLRSYAAS